MSGGHHVNPPMFAPANNRSNRASPGDPPAWLMEGNDPLDVDLLAEYLLDDAKPAPNGMTFDFSIDSGNHSGVVSPEQSEDGGFPPVGEGNNHYQPTAQPHHQIQQPAQPHHQPYQMQPAPAVYAPTPAPPTYSQVPAYAAAQAPMTYSHVSAPPSYAQALAPYAEAPAPAQAMVLAPAQPLGTPVNGEQHDVIHQHVNYAKRQRAEAAAPVHVLGVSPVLSAAPTSSIVSGGQQLVDAAEAAMLGGRGRKKSQAQIDRRRERNRILARRTRLRKKFFFESLQKEVMDLQRQNAALKDLVKTKFSNDESRKVLETCKAVEKLPEAVVEACGEHAAEMDQQDFNLVRSVQQSQHSFIITDPCLQDNPIVFASDGFLKVTGYAREDVLGRNCRFLQGEGTCKAKLDAVRRGVTAAEDVTVTMVNYMADGTPFWNKLFIAALRDSSNNIVNFIGVVVKVAGPPEGDPECGKVLMDEEEEELNGNPSDMGVEGGADGTVRALKGAMTAAVVPAARMP